MAPSADSGIVGPVKPVTLTKNTFVLSLMHGIDCNVSGLASAPKKGWAMGQFQQCWHGSQTDRGSEDLISTSERRWEASCFRFRKSKKKYPLISTAPRIRLCFILPSNSRYAVSSAGVDAKHQARERHSELSSKRRVDPATSVRNDCGEFTSLPNLDSKVAGSAR
jgi:hypothetical protein